MKWKLKISYYSFLLAVFSLILSGCKKEEDSIPVTDEDGNIYKTVKIGTQIWMAENLRTTLYNDGTPITNVTGNSQWAACSSPAYSWYNDDESYKEIYGAIYNWYTVNTGKLCPEGWKVPTDEEYNILEQYLGVPSDNIDDWGWRGTNEGVEMKTRNGWDDNGKRIFCTSWWI
jgi:uncharacterized protein (TIGR02145 family)